MNTQELISEIESSLNTLKQRAEAETHDEYVLLASAAGKIKVIASKIQKHSCQMANEAMTE